jgi:hypothetical protein
LPTEGTELSVEDAGPFAVDAQAFPECVNNVPKLLRGCHHLGRWFSYQCCVDGRIVLCSSPDAAVGRKVKRGLFGVPVTGAVVAASVVAAIPASSHLQPCHQLHCKKSEQQSHPQLAGQCQPSNG